MSTILSADDSYLPARNTRRASRLCNAISSATQDSIRERNELMIEIMVNRMRSDLVRTPARGGASVGIGQSPGGGL